MVSESRVKRLNKRDTRPGKYVLYWMQASQRAEDNHALQYAINKANDAELPVLCLFCLTQEYPEASLRHYQFMIEGLEEVARKLEDKKIGFIATIGSPAEQVPIFAKDASFVITDRDYQRLQRNWRLEVANSIKAPLIQIESNVVVPIEVVSDKEEYAAYTIRPKIQKKLEEFLAEIEPFEAKENFKNSLVQDVNHHTIKEAWKSIETDDYPGSVDWITGGADNAKSRLHKFIENKLDFFDSKRNDPSEDYLSHMSPYLHFGQISPLYIALKIMETDSPGSESYLEELIIRRELSMNFVYYNPNYDSLECLPDWARTTLEKHASDKREFVYTREEFENAETHDEYWNAAQTEMVQRGKMHGYMRMYWSKKILEWTEDPNSAYEIALYLNNKYELDGRDPNGYAGIAWCFGKHDRAWKERPIFGKVRYMNARGLERKFDIDAYVKRVK